MLIPKIFIFGNELIGEQNGNFNIYRWYCVIESRSRI